ncbi:hypothetical protein GSS88_11720 [Corynebacterium sp. 3HC-13]|uniref:hypothetical protein n=1 Tax=Corynebacterium poyangense TaxID=2684405 RepID=UPI001CCA9F1C|nr:hypothetical protein [Corynebacterium poyangense]MBZ8178447.1 hypothetical protein [Corynebacterium poyangense]
MLSPLDIIAGLIAVISTAIIMEKIFPLQSINSADLIWKMRPCLTIPRFRSDMLIQILIFGALGAVIGAGLRHPLFGFIGAALIRCYPLLVRRRTLSTLFSSDHARITNSSILGALDTAAVHYALVATTLRWRFPTPTSSKFIIILRRLTRYPIIALGYLSLSTLAIACHTPYSIALSVPFYLAWILFGSTVAKAGDFQLLHSSPRPRQILAALHALLGAALTTALWSSPLILTALLFLIGGLALEKARRTPVSITGLTDVDVGYGITAPTELLHLYGRGLTIPFILAFGLYFLIQHAS